MGKIMFASSLDHMSGGDAQHCGTIRHEVLSENHSRSSIELIDCLAGVLRTPLQLTLNDSLNGMGLLKFAEVEKRMEGCKNFEF